MQRRSTLLFTMAAIAVMSVTTTAQIKNVLLEQHTGAWCGWCPDGTAMVDEILELYGDRVIGVKIHNGDAMEIPEQRIIANALGLTGFPTASINRASFGGSVFLNRSDWKGSCESQMQQRAKAEVDCFYTLNRSARRAKIRILVNVVESMDFPLKYNAYIVENDVTGTGSGYDQANYLSGRSGYEDNPYYTQPSKIVGYHHMSVVRKMLGGAWGVAGNLPPSVRGGEFYEYEFETDIDTRWNMDSVYFVGFLQADASNNKEIINSAVAVENGAPLNRIIDSDAPAASALPAGSDLLNDCTLENLTNEQQTYTVTLSTTDRTPTDWSAELASGAMTLAASGNDPATGQITVPAGSTTEFSLTLKIGSTLGIGDAEVLFELQGTPTVNRSRIVTGITQEIEHLLLETGSSFSMAPYIDDPAYDNIVTLDPGTYMAFAEELSNVKAVIWNKGPADGLSSEEVETIKNATDVNMFICGDAVIGDLASLDALGYFGLEWIGWNLEARGPTGEIWITGQPGDVITGVLNKHMEGRLIMYYINMVRITSSADVFPIMRFEDDGFRRYNGSTHYIPASDTIFGVRSTKNNRRSVLLGICPYIITGESNRQILVRNILDWLDE